MINEKWKIAACHLKNVQTQIYNINSHGLVCGRICCMLSKVTWIGITVFWNRKGDILPSNVSQAVSVVDLYGNRGFDSRRETCDCIIFLNWSYSCLVSSWCSTPACFWHRLHCLKTPGFLMPRLATSTPREIYSALSPVFSTNVVCVKTQQKLARSNIMMEPNNSKYQLKIGFFRSLEITIILTQVVAHYILHIFLIKMTPYFLKLANLLQSYITFYPSYFIHYLTNRSKVTPIDIVKK